jgi:redox-sensitive bicupin YhaK (pirin superfamily)
MVRVIAGEFAGTRGAARTATPLNVWDVRLAEDHRVEIEIPAGHNAAVVALTGEVKLNGSEGLEEAHIAFLDRAGGRVGIAAGRDATLLVLTGEPIDEPMIARGPFVMTTHEEIRQAVEDYQGGRMGRLTP